MLDFDNEGNACRTGAELNWTKKETTAKSKIENVFPNLIRQFHPI
jgi:hypothetical protein